MRFIQRIYFPGRVRRVPIFVLRAEMWSLRLTLEEHPFPRVRRSSALMFRCEGSESAFMPQHTDGRQS